VKLSRDVRAKCCENILKAGREVKEVKRIGPRVALIVMESGECHKIKMREGSDLIS
jgi:hypothetical protein